MGRFWEHKKAGLRGTTHPAVGGNHAWQEGREMEGNEEISSLDFEKLVESYQAKAMELGFAEHLQV